MIASYLPGESLLHRLPAGAKLLGLAGASLVLLPVDDPRVLGAVLAAVLALYAFLGRRALARLRLVLALIPMVAILALLQAVTQGPGPALAVALRILLMVLMADLVTLTTRLDDMMATLEAALSPLARLGVPTRRLALAVALVIRFVPVLLAQWQARLESWRARSARRPSLVLVAAFFAGTLRMADHVAEALDARGFSAPHAEHPDAPRPDAGRQT